MPRSAPSRAAASPAAGRCMPYATASRACWMRPSSRCWRATSAASSSPAAPCSAARAARNSSSLRAASQRGKTHALAVIAEGAKCGVHELMEYYGAHRKSIGFDLRVTRLGHVVRGGIPSAADRVLATRLGAAAIDTLAQGKHGVLAGIVKGDMVTTPLTEIAGKMRSADAC